MYASGCDKFNFKFTRNRVIGCNGLKALVMMHPYNSLEAGIYNDLV